MANWLNLDGKVVIVTGGASGIGNHVVTTLKDAGATPVIADISVETGEEKDGIFCTKCDVTSKESVEAMVAAVVEKYGKLDEVGNLVAFLVSDRSSYIAGTTYNISGGKSRG